MALQGTYVQNPVREASYGFSGSRWDVCSHCCCSYYWDRLQSHFVSVTMQSINWTLVQGAKVLCSWVQCPSWYCVLRWLSSPDVPAGYVNGACSTWWCQWNGLSVQYRSDHIHRDYGTLLVSSIAGCPWLTEGRKSVSSGKVPLTWWCAGEAPC